MTRPQDLLGPKPYVGSASGDGSRAAAGWLVAVGLIEVASAIRDLASAVASHKTNGQEFR